MMAAPPEPDFVALLAKVERERGFACASYKHSCLRRRIRTRMRIRETETYEAYAGLLDRDPGELDKLVEALTINVTRFFRNKPVWDAIATAVVPDLWGRDTPAIRVWSAGCASGEEALSMAILFHRHAALNGMLAQINRVSVTASDVDPTPLRAAERGAYSEADLAEVPPALRQRYFSGDPPFRASPGIRRMVRFIRHDLLVDDFLQPRQDVIICRNVLIYFERAAQEQVIRRLQDSLEPGGYLILGRVESLLGATRRGFEAVAQRERIFRKVG